MSDQIELTMDNLLEGLAGELQASGPGRVTREFNEALISHFRANDGVLPGDMGRQFLLLTTTGARSGKQRTTPLAYFR